MKRSEIDTVIDDARRLAAEFGTPLPGFAAWTRDDWQRNAPRAGSAVARRLGWDVTDFGRGDFDRVGLCLCTLRNGTVAERDDGSGQTYAEKLMIVRDGQETPMHLHRRKTEDIINRGGATLIAELHPEASGGRGGGTVTTLVDGLSTEVPAGSRLRVRPGESVQVPAGTFHRFWAEGGVVLAAEVSSVNDDDHDNTFLQPSPRYPSVDEDAPARYLLVGEYDAVLAGRGDENAVRRDLSAP